MSAELKPCPFCGGEAHMHDGSGWYGAGCSTVSNGVMCYGYLSARQYRDPNYAAAAWNRRTTQPAPSTAPEEVLRKKKQMVIDGDFLYDFDLEQIRSAHAAIATQPAPIPVQAGEAIDGPTEREISILRFALRRLSLNAHALANEAAQDKDGRLYTPGSVEAFQRDAEDAERLLGNLNAVVAHIKAGGQGGEDGARLDWMAVNEAWIAWNCESTRCRVLHQAEDGELRPIMGYSDKAWASSPREAIDAARATHAKANYGEGANGNEV